MMNINFFLQNKVLVVVKDVFMTSGKVFSRAKLKKTQSCQDVVCQSLKKHGLSYEVVPRSELRGEFRKRLVISIGGDGTLLNTSHYCHDSILVGVNSNPHQSIGALCSLNEGNFEKKFFKNLQNVDDIIPFYRLEIFLNNDLLPQRALNEVLFCHKDPASISRYTLRLKGEEETHRSSGIIISTGGGSTGAIYSAFGEEFSPQLPKAQFLAREFYWSNRAIPRLFQGFFEKSEELIITSEIEDCVIYLDGSHEKIKIDKNTDVKIKVSDDKIYILNKSELLEKRQKLLNQRNIVRKALFKG